MKHENYTKQELADIREKEHDQWFSDKFDEILSEDCQEMTPTEFYDYATKDMVAFKLSKNDLKIFYTNNRESYFGLGNRDNNFIAQMIINLHKDKELK